MADARYFDDLYSGYSGPPQGWGIGKEQRYLGGRGGVCSAAAC